MALMVNLLLPITVGLFLSSRRAWQRGFLFFAICMEAGTVMLTHSRAGTLTLALIVVLYLWKLRRKSERSLLYALLLAGILALPLLPSSYFERMSSITSMSLDRTGSAQERMTDSLIAAKTILANPVIGAGMGMNMLAMREARGDWRQVHNIYLEHAIDLGLPGLAIFLALLVSCITAVARIPERNVSLELTTLAEGLQISLSAYAVEAMFHPVSYHYYFYYIAGLAIAARTIADAQTGRTPEATA